jgi:hypothetical protein
LAAFGALYLASASTVSGFSHGNGVCSASVEVALSAKAASGYALAITALKAAAKVGKFAKRRPFIITSLRVSTRLHGTFNVLCVATLLDRSTVDGENAVRSTPGQP